MVLAASLTTITAQELPLYTVAEFPVSSLTGGIAGFGLGSFSPAQTFTVMGSGELQDISLALAQDGPALPNHVVIEFRNTVDGAPSSFVVASATISGSLLMGVEPGSPVMLTADFSSYHISLSSGSAYAFSLRTDNAGFAFACGSGAYFGHNYAGGSMFVTYDSGTTWQAKSSYDINFQITAIPEPSTPALIGMGVTVVLFGSLTRRGETAQTFSGQGRANGGSRSAQKQIRCQRRRPPVAHLSVRPTA
jgi:hypothetical protein